MKNKLKAWLLMSPFIVLVFLTIVGILHAIRNLCDITTLISVGLLGVLFLIGWLFEKGLELYYESKCICTKTCDCQDPEGKLNGSNGGVCLKSNECPIHNDEPDPHPDCKVHNKE